MINLLERANELVILIDRHFFEKYVLYFLEMYFLTLRELCWYCQSKGSSISSRKDDFSEKEILLFGSIKDIRDAISHRTSENNKLGDHLWISGGRNFKENDVQIQYGECAVFLVKELFVLHRKVKQIIKEEFPYIKRHFENELSPDRTECVMNHISATLTDEEYVRHNFFERF